MSVLDEKDPSTSLKTIVIGVAVVTLGLFAALFMANNAHAAHASTAPAQSAPAQ